jgi:hypothetical protein
MPRVSVRNSCHSRRWDLRAGLAAGSSTMTSTG